jgi:hypothetical protein
MVEYDEISEFIAVELLVCCWGLLSSEFLDLGLSSDIIDEIICLRN